MRAPHAGVIRRRVADLRRLGRAGERDRGVDLGSSGPNGGRRSADTPSAGTRRCGALGRLRCKTVGYGALGRILLERRLLRLRRGGRGRDGESWRALGHLVLRAHLLVLGRRRRRRGQLALTTAGHDAVEKTVAGGNGRRLLRRAGMGRRPADAGRRVSTSSFELAAEHRDFFLVPVGNSMVSIL